MRRCRRSLTRRMTAQYMEVGWSSSDSRPTMHLRYWVWWPSCPVWVHPAGPQLDRRWVERTALGSYSLSDRHMSDGEILSIKMLSSGTMCWLYLCIYFLGCHSRVKRFDVLSAWTTIRALSSLPPFNEPVKCLYYFTVNFLAELSAITVDCSAVCWVVSWVLTSELDGDTTWGLCTGLKWI